MAERGNGYVTAMPDGELTEYRKRLEDVLAHAEIPKYYVPSEQLQEQLATVLAEQEARRGRAMRAHDVASLTDTELDRARRQLAATLALARPDSPIRWPVTAQLSAIDTEKAERERLERTNTS